jgi:hypothetical protein
VGQWKGQHRVIFPVATATPLRQLRRRHLSALIKLIGARRRLHGATSSTRATLGGVDGNHFAGGRLEHELAGQAGDRAGQSLAAEQDNDVTAVAETKRDGRVDEMNAAVGFDGVSRHGQLPKIIERNRNKRYLTPGSVA